MRATTARRAPTAHGGLVRRRRGDPCDADDDDGTDDLTDWSDFTATAPLSCASPTLAFTDPALPPRAFFYLVRATNGCGSMLGYGSFAAERQGSSCP